MNTIEYNTVLLDRNNEVLAIGNPLNNLKIRDLYLDIMGCANNFEQKKFYENVSVAQISVIPADMKGIGLVHRGDTIITEFEINNNSDKLLTIQDIVASCNCVTAVTSFESVKSGGRMNVKVQYVPENETGFISRYVDIYFIEMEIPLRIFIYGYV